MALQVDPKNNNADDRLKKYKRREMTPKVTEQSAFMVVGIAARTSNENEMGGDGVIAKQWGRLFQESLLEQIPNKADQNVVAVYTDYASDHNGEYTFLLGSRVTSDANVPLGMVSRKIAGGKFAVFTTEKGPADRVVPSAWMEINSLPRTSVGGERVYSSDYEIYDERARDPQDMQADIYVGIR